MFLGESGVVYIVRLIGGQIMLHKILEELVEEKTKAIKCWFVVDILDHLW